MTRHSDPSAVQQTDTSCGAPDRSFAGDFTRRDFARLAAMPVLAAGAAGLLDAFGSAAASASTSPIVRGGTLRAGLAGGTASDTLDAHAGVNTVDFARFNQLYNALVEYTRDGTLQLMLAEEVVPNATATQWTIRVRQGVEFHNGRPLGADDIIFNFKRITNKAHPLNGASALPPIASLTKLDQRTVRITFETPYSIFYQVLAGYFFYIVPVGYDPKKPIGTGPFKYHSFTPGLQSVFLKNPNYWQTGLPYIDELIMNDYNEETAQVNALIGGQLDAIDQLSAGSLLALKNANQPTVISNGGAYAPITMRMDLAPFSDVRVRQALRLLADRPQMRKEVFLGNGLLGNDIFGIIDPMYDHAIPQRHQDIDQARSLLKQAGRENLNVQLVVAPLAQGIVETVEVFAQQARSAGVTVSVRQVTSTELDGQEFLKWPFAVDTWYGIPYYTNVCLSQAAKAFDNETHNDIPRYQALYQSALRTPDIAKQTEIAHEMEMIDYTQGGYIIPMFTPNIDGHSSRLHNVVPGHVGLGFGGYEFKNYWLT